MTADDLRAWRHRLGLTQAEASELLGVSVRHIETMEGAQIRTALAMAAAWLEEHPPLRRTT